MIRSSIKSSIRSSVRPALGAAAGGGVAALAAQGKLALWLNFSALSSLWLDDMEVGGNITAHGQTIGKADDRSGNSRDFDQSDTAKEPEFQKLLKVNADLSGEAELVDTANTAASWETFGSNVIEQDGAAVKITVGTGTAYIFGGRVYLDESNGLSQDLEAGKAYYIEAEVSVDTDTASVLRVVNDATVIELPFSSSSYTTVGTLIHYTSGDVLINFGGSLDTGELVRIRNISVKEVPESKLYKASAGDGSAALLTGSPFAYAQGSAAFVFGVKGDAQSAKFIHAERNTSDGDTDYAITSGSSDSGKLRLLIINDAAQIRLNVESTVDVFDGDPHVGTVLDTGSGYEFRVDGASAGSGSYTRSGALTPNISSLLASKSTIEGGHFDGAICDQFIVFKSGWTDSMISTAEAEIAANIGITLS